MKKKWSADKCFMLIMGMLMQAVFLFPWIQITMKDGVILENLYRTGMGEEFYHTILKNMEKI